MPFGIPVPSAREPQGLLSDADSSAARVVVIDDDIEAAVLEGDSTTGLRIDVASDAWTALEALGARPRPALVICSASMRLEDGPLYRWLWGAYPELKWRFVLVASARAIGDLDVPSRRLLLERPLTRERIAEVLRQHGRR